MNAEIKAKWLEALRSGRYKQTKEYLRRNFSDGSEFCCLGVLCDIVEPENWKGGAHAEAHADGNEMPSRELALKVGVPKYKRNADEVSLNVLSEMNDEGKTFAEIADYIEENL